MGRGRRVRDPDRFRLAAGRGTRIPQMGDEVLRDLVPPPHTSRFPPEILPKREKAQYL